MEIKIKRIAGDYKMLATNEDGNTVMTDASLGIGGTNEAMRPMHLMLVGLGSCSSIDVISILLKQKQSIEDIQITVTGDRVPDKVPSLFTKINVHYTLTGDLDESKVIRAIELSMDKYCSVAMILQETAKISWTFEIIR